MLDLAAGGNDINSVMADALGLLAKSAGVGTLLSIFGKMTLDVMQTPVREQIQDWQNQDINDINEQKYQGIEVFEKWLKRQQKSVLFFPKNYFFYGISYETMQGLLDGTIKNWKRLNQKLR